MKFCIIIHIDLYILHRNHETIHLLSKLCNMLIIMVVVHSYAGK